jgi:polysaccharide export outer membrane protein
VLDALSAAGDLTVYGERENVLIIREENGKRTAHRLNLNSSEVFTSPYFYLQQNDYVYVSPNKIRKDNSKYNQNNAFKLSVVSTVVSGCSVIASLVIALAIK